MAFVGIRLGAKKMARARNIKPAFFDNDALGELEPLARLLFIGMWTIADYKGDFEWREKRVKAKILPYDDCDIKKLAINLDKSGFIRFYSDGENIYCNVVNFSSHQNPHKNEREKGSDIPEYSEKMRQLVDLKGITINPDKSRLKQECSHSDRADSLNLIPDTLKPITDETYVSFEDFWMNWPKKTDKKNAEKVWKKLKVTDELYQSIVNHCTRAYLKTDKQYIPNPSTYLNQERWNDEILETVQPKSGGYQNDNARQFEELFAPENNSGFVREIDGLVCPQVDYQDKG